MTQCIVQLDAFAVEQVVFEKHMLFKSVEQRSRPDLFSSVSFFDAIDDDDAPEIGIDLHFGFYRSVGQCAPLLVVRFAVPLVEQVVE